MSKPNVKFTNNLGTIEFERCQISVQTEWEWRGSNAVKTQRITVEGWATRGEDLGDDLIQDTTLGEKGQRGTLTLPWTTVNNVTIDSIDVPLNLWIDWMPITASFTDDSFTFDRHVLTYFGWDIYNPQITVGIPEQPLNDEYPKMPWMTSWNASGVRNGVIRNRSGETDTEVTIIGTVRVEGPDQVLQMCRDIMHRSGLNGVPIPSGMKAGDPAPFNLGDACPQLEENMNYAHCMAMANRVSYYPTRRQAHVNIMLLCPPQLPVEGG